MKLKIKTLKWTAGAPVAMLNRVTAEKAGIHIHDRISIKTLSKPFKEIKTIVDLVAGIIRKDELAVSSEIKKRLGLRNGQKVDIVISPIPKSLEYIKKKLNGKKLRKKQIEEIIDDVVSNSLSEPEIALFVSAMYKNGMNFKEEIYLIKAILKSGNTLNLKDKFVVDKHSIGGVAGNRTTPLVVSICNAAGLTIPKTSSRAITSAAGTADVIETIARIEFPIEDLKKILRKTKGCMVCGGSLGMVPADSRIIHVEKMLKIDPEAQLLASIIAKKLAVNSKYILIDIPYGKSAKLSKQKAEKLKKKFVRLGKYFKRELKVVLTDGKQPIGNGVGPVLELLDIIQVLDPRQDGPIDLEDKSVFLSAQLLEMTGKVEKGKGEDFAKRILHSGKAYDSFKKIIKAQEGSLKSLNVGKYKKNMLAKRNGKILEIDNKLINNLARSAGCPTDKAAGLYLHFHVGERVKKGQKLITIYSESKTRLNTAVNFYNKRKPIKLR